MGQRLKAAGAWLKRAGAVTIRGIGQGIAVTARATGLAAWRALTGLGRGATWLFEGVRPLRIAAFGFIVLVGAAMAWLNTRGAYERTGDVAYAGIILGIEGVVLVALPIIFAVRGWFTTPVAVAIFGAGIAIASFNAKPALERILNHGEAVADSAEKLKQADKLEDEVYGLRDPDTGLRIEGSGLLAQVMRMEAEASHNRVELGHTTASTAVDAEALKGRGTIAAKLQQAEEYRALARGASEAGWLAIITYVVAELIRSFGLKVLVGFDPQGTGRGTRPTVPTSSSTAAPDPVDDAFSELMRDVQALTDHMRDVAPVPSAAPPPKPREDFTDKQHAGAKGADAKDHYAGAGDATKLGIPPQATVDEGLA